MSNQTLLRETAHTVHAFAAHQASLEELQAKLQSVVTLLERDDVDPDVFKVIYNVEGDLERIKFTVFGDDVHPAVTAALEPLLPYLPAEG